MEVIEDPIWCTECGMMPPAIINNERERVTSCCHAEPTDEQEVARDARARRQTL